MMLDAVIVWLFSNKVKATYFFVVWPDWPKFWVIQNNTEKFENTENNTETQFQKVSIFVCFRLLKFGVFETYKKVFIDYVHFVFVHMFQSSIV